MRFLRRSGMKRWHRVVVEGRTIWTACGQIFDGHRAHERATVVLSKNICKLCKQ